MIPKNHNEKSHSGTPGSKAACAYPGHFAACRALVQLSSRAILQTAWHVGPFGGVRLAFGETLSFMCASLLPVRGVILRFELIHPSLRNPTIVELHVFDDLAYVAKTVLEALVADISVASLCISILSADLEWF